MNANLTQFKKKLAIAGAIAAMAPLCAVTMTGFQKYSAEQTIKDAQKECFAKAGVPNFVFVVKNIDGNQLLVRLNDSKAGLTTFAYSFATGDVSLVDREKASRLSRPFTPNVAKTYKEAIQTCGNDSLK